MRHLNHDTVSLQHALNCACRLLQDLLGPCRATMYARHRSNLQENPVPFYCRDSQTLQHKTNHAGPRNRLRRRPYSLSCYVAFRSSCTNPFDRHFTNAVRATFSFTLPTQGIYHSECLRRRGRRRYARGTSWIIPKPPRWNQAQRPLALGSMSLDMRRNQRPSAHRLSLKRGGLRHHDNPVVACERAVDQLLRGLLREEIHDRHDDESAEHGERTGVDGRL